MEAIVVSVVGLVVLGLGVLILGGRLRVSRRQVTVESGPIERD
jgi:hypothetical protein